MQTKWNKIQQKNTRSKKKKNVKEAFFFYSQNFNGFGSSYQYLRFSILTLSLVFFFEESIFFPELLSASRGHTHLSSPFDSWISFFSGMSKKQLNNNFNSILIFVDHFNKETQNWFKSNWKFQRCEFGSSRNLRLIQKFPSFFQQKSYIKFIVSLFSC